jgi:hypothetical protein
MRFRMLNYPMTQSDFKVVEKDGSTSIWFLAERSQVV